ncbi:MAG: tRNA lysidine(34) synthetase TilS [Burkholderiaceae bacterium]|nr:MAG: tRNA lysidine(34) synthetase TilS [Burkholderiaceae bacterium]
MTLPDGGPDPSGVSALRRRVVAAVVGDLARLAGGWSATPPGRPLVLVGCSGGADSVALAAAAARAVELRGWCWGAVVVDHGLQQGSADAAARAGHLCADLGAALVLVRRVEVRPAASAGGPEAAARAARYDAFDEALQASGALALLLGHTADDQAETVLLRLARGSGPRSLAGMPAERGPFRRPLLELPRADVRAAFPELAVWQDPHNEDPAYARVRVRRALPALEQALGPGLAASLARSAVQVRAEVEALDRWCDEVWPSVVELRELRGAVAVRLDARQLAGRPEALVQRVLARAADLAGAPRERLTAAHYAPLHAMIRRWRGQGPTQLPGGVVGYRESDTVVLVRRPDGAEREEFGGPQ